MKFAQDSQDEGYIFTSYDKTSVSINGKPFEQSLIISSQRVEENWSLTAIELLSSTHIEKILSFEPELIIIGTGNRLLFPPVAAYSAAISHGIGIDFMDTRAACRTYNILVSEDRNIVAGLIL